MSVWIDGRGELGEIARLGRGYSAGRRTRDSLLVLAADLGSDRAGAQTATKIKEADADEEDPEGHPARAVLAPALSDRRRVGRDQRGEPGRRQRVRDRLGRRQGRRGLHRRTVGERVVRRLGRRARPRVADRRARAYARVAAPVSAHLGRRTRCVDRRLRVRSRRRHRHRAACSASARSRPSSTSRGWRSPTTRRSGARALAAAARSPAGSASTARTTRSSPATRSPGARFQQRIWPNADGSRVATILETAVDSAGGRLPRGGEPRAVTSLNAELAPQLRACEWRPYTWESFDGLEIEGLLALPRGSENGSLPLVVFVHGGPTGTWSWCFPHLCRAAPRAGGLRDLPSQPARLERARPGVRAREPRRHGRRRPPGHPRRSRRARRDGIADDARVAITGGSYGGFMASWAVTQTDRFAASIPFAVVTDWTSFHYTTNIGHFDALFLQGEPNDPTRPVPAALAGLPRGEVQDADADPPRRGRPLHAAAAGDGVLQRARRGRVRGRARRLPARGSRLDGARAPDRLVEPRARLARAAREGPRVSGAPRIRIEYCVP